jgi:hypothetical protein
VLRQLPAAPHTLQGSSDTPAYMHTSGCRGGLLPSAQIAPVTPTHLHSGQVLTSAGTLTQLLNRANCCNNARADDAKPQLQPPHKTPGNRTYLHSGQVLTSAGSLTPRGWGAGGGGAGGGGSAAPDANLSSADVYHHSRTCRNSIAIGSDMPNKMYEAGMYVC